MNEPQQELRTESEVGDIGHPGVNGPIGIDAPPEGDGLILQRLFPPQYSGDLSPEAVTLHFDQYVSAVLDRYRAASADGKITFGEAFGVVGELCAAAAFVIKAFYDAKTDETERGFDEIVAAAEAAFDNNIVPIDFPPNAMIEMYLEAQARAMIRPALTYLRDKIRSTPR